jgi:outer membrane protein
MAFLTAFGMSTQPAFGMDLLEAVRAAMDSDPGVSSARAQAGAVRERINQSRAGLLPSLSATAGFNYNAINTTVAPTRFYDGQSLGVLANVPIYRPANREALLQSELSAEIAELQLIQAQQDLVIRVATAYFDVLAAQDSLAVVRAQKRAFGEQFESARRNFEVGTATITDQQEAQSRLDLTAAQEVAILNDLEVKRALLAQLIGRPVTELNTLREGIEVSAPQGAREAEWALRARESNLAVRQAELTRQVAEKEIERQRFGHYPTLDLTSQAQFGRSNNAQNAANLVGVRSQFGQVGLQFALPIYSGGAVDSRVREAIALQGKAESDLEAARRTAEQAARQGFLGVRSGIEQVRALTAAERSSKLALESNQLGYQVGVRINIDVLNAAQQLFTTQRDLARARYDVLLNSLRLRNVANALTEEEVAQVNALLEPPRAAAAGIPAAIPLGTGTPTGNTIGAADKPAAGGSTAAGSTSPSATPAGSAPRGGRSGVPRVQPPAGSR